MNVTINVVCAPMTLASGIVPGQLSLSITDGSGKPVSDSAGNALAPQKVNGLAATFSNVPDGSYLASAVRLDTNGDPIGTPVNQAFSVSAPGVTTYDAPQSITVTLG